MTFSRILFIAAIAAGFLLFVVLPSFPHVRRILARPLVVHNPSAHGDACYVLGGGGAMWERLDAAADLVQMGRVPRLILMEDNSRAHYSFKTKSSWTRTQWMSEYLAWRGVPATKVLWFPAAKGRFGTLTEARAVAGILPKEVHTLVVVSSAPHTKRCMLAFGRSLQGRAAVVPYAATDFTDSYELHHPIWIEYLKLLVYFVVS